MTLIETALAGTRGWATPALFAELHIRQELALATLSDTSACTAAITQAELLTPDDDPPWLYWLGPAKIAIDAGQCFLQLGQAEHAAARLQEGLAQLPGSFVRERQIDITYLADALASSVTAGPGIEHCPSAGACGSGAAVPYGSPELPYQGTCPA